MFLPCRRRVQVIQVVAEGGAKRNLAFHFSDIKPLLLVCIPRVVTHFTGK